MELKLSPAHRRYGYIKNPPDFRDYGITHRSMPRLVIPSYGRTFNGGYLGPVRDQGQQGSCTGHAAMGNADYLYNRFKPLPHNLGYNFSPAFIYYQARVVDGSVSQGDCGSTGRSVATACQKYGACTNVEMPYDENVFSVAPTANQLTDGLIFPSGAYSMLANVQDIRTALASGYCVMWGFNVYDSFENDIHADGLMPTPDYSRESLLGGHETLIFDYDDNQKGGDGTVGAFWVRNSWGGAWGGGGDFIVSYTQMADPNISLDWTLQHLGLTMT